MKAIGVMTFGGPEVLHVVELPEPHAEMHRDALEKMDTCLRGAREGGVI